MGTQRAAYANFEQRVLALYEQKLLTLDLLDLVACQYQSEGIDSAGSQALRAQDGKDFHQICIALVDPTFPIVVQGSREDHEEYWERELKKWEEIVAERWRLVPLRYQLSFYFSSTKNMLPNAACFRPVSARQKHAGH